MSNLNSPTESGKMSGYIPALDGLRGCAVLLVIAYHTCIGGALPSVLNFLASLGWAGVDLFFVLSGYLITEILLRNRDSTTYYSTFYARRGLRIAPLYYLALIIIFVIKPPVYHLLHPSYSQELLSFNQQVLYWLNLSNLRSAFFPLEALLVSVFWSLAIEEQFYALWPTVVRRLTDRSVTLACLGGITLSILLRCLPAVQSYNLTHDNFIYRLTPFRLDGLLLGALLAVYLRARPDPVKLKLATAAALVLGLSGLFAILISSHFDTFFASPAMSKFGFTAMALVFASLVSLCVSPQGPIARTIARCFALPILRSFGKYSYFLYVFHVTVFYVTAHPIHHALRGLNPIAGTYLAAAIGTGICYALAALSWRFFEQPILRCKRRFPYRFNSAKPAPAASELTPAQAR